MNPFAAKRNQSEHDSDRELETDSDLPRTSIPLLTDTQGTRSWMLPYSAPLPSAFAPDCLASLLEVPA